MIRLEKDMEKYVKKYKYLVVFPDKKVELFKSLRDIQESICIDSSTISKNVSISTDHPLVLTLTVPADILASEADTLKLSEDTP